MVTRRRFLIRTSTGVLSLNGLDYVSPLATHASQVNMASQEEMKSNSGKDSCHSLQILSKHEAKVYDAWCNVLAIGAKKAKVSRYLDKYLSSPVEESLLFLRYLNNPPMDAFYLTGIAGIEAESASHFSKSFLKLDKTEKKFIVDLAAKASTTVWTNPPPAFFYFVSRSDAVDVVYGTVKGFRKLKVPYQAHIRPPSRW